jgi:Retinoblastoma-associated protein A domain
MPVRIRTHTLHVHACKPDGMMCIHKQQLTQVIVATRGLYLRTLESILTAETVALGTTDHSKLLQAPCGFQTALLLCCFEVSSAAVCALVTVSCVTDRNVTRTQTI